MNTTNRFNFWYFKKYGDANPANRDMHRANGTRSPHYQAAINPNSPTNALSAYFLALAAQIEAEVKQAPLEKALTYYKKAERWSKIAAIAALSNFEDEATKLEGKSRYSNLALKAYAKREEFKAIIASLENSITTSEEASQFNTTARYPLKI